MAITTIRPNASSAALFTVTGAASAHAALADDDDLSFIRRTSTTAQGAAVVDFATFSIPAGSAVRQLRLRVRTETPEPGSRVTFALRSLLPSGALVIYPAYQRKGVRALDTYVGPWQPPEAAGNPQGFVDGLNIRLVDYATSGPARAFVYELFIDVDVVSRPSVTVDAPTGTVTASSRPTVQWTYADVDGDPQGWYQVRVFTDAQVAAPDFDVATDRPVWDSGEVTSDNDFALLGVVLENGDYVTYVRVAKTVNGQPYWSTWQSEPFTMAVVPPATPTVTASHVIAEGRVAVEVVGSVPTGFDSQTFELQRSADGSTWVGVRDADVLFPNASYEAGVSDYEAPRGGTVFYRARSIGVLAGAQFASDWSTVASVAVPNDGLWWFKPLAAPALTAGGLQVLVGPDQTLVEQSGTFRPIGRGSAVVVTGGTAGRDGTFRLVTRDAAAWDELYAILSHEGVVYVEDPFGQSLYVRFVDRSWRLEGTPSTARRRVEVAYVETAG
jgi:hypothetical protein